MKKVLIRLLALVGFAFASSAAALPVNSATANGNFITFYFDNTIGATGEVAVQQNKTEFLVKFIARINGEPGAPTEHTLHYSLKRGAVREADKFTIDHCMRLFLQAASAGGQFFVSVDAAGVTTCALRPTP